MNPVKEEIERIRAVCRQISAECGDDSQRLVEYYRQVAAELRATGRYKFVGPAPAKSAEDLALREQPKHPSGSCICQDQDYLTVYQRKYC